MVCAPDHEVPSNVTALPSGNAATQNELDGHDTESIQLLGFTYWAEDHEVPS